MAMELAGKTSVAQKVAQTFYRMSADPEAPENKDSIEFQGGFVKGMDHRVGHNGMVGIEQESIRRAFPAFRSPEWDSFNEWKRGFWAGFFTRLQAELNQRKVGAA